MRDVFQYLKFARTLREGAAADEAHKKGYTSDGSGYWLDRQGNRVAYTKGGKLIELTPRDKKALEAGQEPGQQPEQPEGEEQQEKEPMTFSNFNSQLNRLVPGGPTPQALDDKNVEMVARQLSRMRFDVLDANQKKAYLEKARAAIAKAEADKLAAAQAAQQPEPEPEPEVDPDQAEIEKLEMDNRKLELQNQKKELELRQKELEGGGEETKAEPKKEETEEGEDEDWDDEEEQFDKWIKAGKPGGDFDKWMETQKSGGEKKPTEKKESKPVDLSGISDLAGEGKPSPMPIKRKKFEGSKFHEKINQDGTRIKESMSIRAIKDSLVDGKDIDSEEYLDDMIKSYGQFAARKEIKSSRSQAKAFKNLVESRAGDEADEIFANLKVGRVGETNDDLGDRAAPQYGDAINSIWDSLPITFRKEKYFSHMKDSWNPTDTYAIDGRYEKDLLNEMNALRSKFPASEDPESLMTSINELSRKYIDENKLFPLSLKQSGDNESQINLHNQKPYDKGMARVGLMTLLKPIAMNLSLSNEPGKVDFDSNSLNIPVSMDLNSIYEDGSDGGMANYKFDYRIQKMGKDDNPLALNTLRSEPLPQKKTSPSYGKYDATDAKKPKPNARKYKNNEAQYKKDLEAWEDRRKQAENDVGWTMDPSDKFGAVPADYLREQLMKLSGMPDQAHMMGIEGNPYPDPGPFTGKREGTAAHKKWLEATEKFKSGQIANYKFRDFNDEERSFWRDKLNNLYGTEYDKDFSVDTPDLKIGNKVYTKQNLSEYVDDLLTIANENKSGVSAYKEERPLTDELFGRTGVKWNNNDINNKIRLALQRIATVSGMIDAHRKGTLGDIIGQGFMRASKTYGNQFYPLYKMEKKRNYSEHVERFLEKNRFAIDNLAGFVLYY